MLTLANSTEKEERKEKKERLGCKGVYPGALMILFELLEENQHLNSTITSRSSH